MSVLFRKNWNHSSIFLRASSYFIHMCVCVCLYTHIGKGEQTLFCQRSVETFEKNVFTMKKSNDSENKSINLLLKGEIIMHDSS